MHFRMLTVPNTDLQDHRAPSILRFRPTNRQGCWAELKNSMGIIRSSDGNCDVRCSSQAGCTKNITNGQCYWVSYMCMCIKNTFIVKSIKLKKIANMTAKFIIYLMIINIVDITN